MFKKIFFIGLLIATLLPISLFNPLSTINAEDQLSALIYNWCVFSPIGNPSKDRPFNINDPNAICFANPSTVSFTCNEALGPCPANLPYYLKYSCTPDQIEEKDCKEMYTHQQLLNIDSYLKDPEKFNYKNYGPLTVRTPFGNLNPTNLPVLAGQFVTFAIGIAGITALFLIIMGSFGVMTSNGAPDKLNESKQTITNAVMGVAFIILTIAIIRIIGGTILKLPNF